MSRSRVTNPKTLAKLSARIGQPVAFAFARGNTDHRIDCCLPDGRIVSLYRDGQFETVAGETWDGYRAGD